MACMIDRLGWCDRWVILDGSTWVDAVEPMLGSVVGRWWSYSKAFPDLLKCKYTSRWLVWDRLA